MSAKIPRSVREATRFTSTSPHATAKSIPSSIARIPTHARLSKIRPPPLKTVAPPGETPLEKVKRLRAALDKANAEKETPLERMILRGRVWADRAHRITITFLILFTILGTIFSIGAFIKVAIFNRRRGDDFLTDKKAAYAAGLVVSRQAIVDGTANQAQIDLVRYDDEETARLAEIEVKEEGKKGRWWRGIKEFMFGGLKPEHDYDALKKLVGQAVSNPDEEVTAANQDGRRMIEEQSTLSNSMTEDSSMKSNGSWGSWFTPGDATKIAMHNDSTRERTRNEEFSKSEIDARLNATKDSERERARIKKESIL